MRQVTKNKTPAKIADKKPAFAIRLAASSKFRRKSKIKAISPESPPMTEEGGIAKPSLARVGKENRMPEIELPS